MQKKAIPILIATMIIALAGIIFIQYLWIRKSVSEKQALIDNNVLQAISNVDHQLSDYGALAFFTGEMKLSQPFSDSLLILEDSIGQVEIVRPLHHPQWDTTHEMKVQVITSHEKNGDSIRISHTEIENYQHSADSIRIELTQIENELLKLEEVRSVFNQIRFETDSLVGDFRLDSIRVRDLLNKEFLSFHLDTALNWGIYDETKNEFSIQPKSSNGFNYEVPLFKNDIIHPGRYILKLQLINNSAMIWTDIRWMVFMSVLFSAIILSVFLFALRLIIKHKKISQIKSDFINNMTHEFKTPLASISLAADSIVHPNIISDPKRIQDYVAIIQDEKSRLNQNVQRILEVAVLEKDNVTLPSEQFNLTDLIHQTVHNLQLVIQNKKATVNLMLADSVILCGSPFHFSQALSNIIENGIKYSPENPILKISLTEKDNTVIIEITDHGIGMTTDQLNRVFETFYRAETGNIHNTKGFGLGLTYARFVIEKMGGKIKLESKINHGTTVQIQFQKP